MMWSPARSATARTTLGSVIHARRRNSTSYKVRFDTCDLPRRIQQRPLARCIDGSDRSCVSTMIASDADAVRSEALSVFREPRLQRQTVPGASRFACGEGDDHPAHRWFRSSDTYPSPCKALVHTAVIKSREHSAYVKKAVGACLASGRLRTIRSASAVVTPLRAQNQFE